MAVQLHVAYSATFKGAGVIAGGPVLLRRRVDHVNATGRCMTHDSASPVATLVHTDEVMGRERLASTRSRISQARRCTCSPARNDSVGAGAGDERPASATTQLRAGREHRATAATCRPNTACRPTTTAAPAATAACRTSTTAASTAPARCCTQLYGALEARNNGALAGTLHRVRSDEFIGARARHGEHRLGLRAAGVRAGNARAGCTWCCTAAGRTSTTLGHAYVKQHRLQPLGRQQPHRRAVPADQQPQRAQQPAGTGGATRRRLRAEERPQMAAIKAMVDRVASVSGGRRRCRRRPASAPRRHRCSMMIAGARERRGGLQRLSRRRQGQCIAVPATSYTDTGLAPAPPTAGP